MTASSLPSSEEIKKMVCHAIQEVTQTMLGTEAKLETHRVVEKGEETETSLMDDESGVVFGNIGFAGIATGMVYFGMSQAAAQRIASRMLEMTIEEVSDGHGLVNDVIGELSNMTAGTFKNQLCDRGLNCRLSIPSIIRGKYFVVEGDEAELREIFGFRINEDVVMFELFMKLDKGGDDDGRL